MTLAEFGLFVEGKNDEFKRTQKLYAWHAINIMSPHVKKKIKMSDLLPDEKDGKMEESELFKAIQGGSPSAPKPTLEQFKAKMNAMAEKKQPEQQPLFEELGPVVFTDEEEDE